MDTTRSSASQHASTALESERRTSTQDFRLRPVSASVGINVQNHSRPVIDLTEDEQVPRKKIRLDNHTDASNSTPDCQYNMNPLSLAPSHPSDPVMRHSDITQISPSVSVLPSEQGEVRSGPAIVAPSTDHEIDDYGPCVDEIIEEPDADGRRVCKLCA
jgi:hypothetical protein